LAADTTLDALSSDDNTANALIYKQDDNGAYPVLALGSAVDSTSSILLDFIDETQEVSAPEINKILIGFTHENMADETKFLLNPANTNNLYFYSIEKSGSGLLIKHAKATPTITPPTAGNVTNGQTLANSMLAGGSADMNGIPVPGAFTWADNTTIVNASGEYDIVFTPDDTANFKIVSGIEVFVTATGSNSNNNNNGSIVTPNDPNGSFDGNVDTYEKDSGKLKRPQKVRQKAIKPKKGLEFCIVQGLSPVVLL